MCGIAGLIGARPVTRAAVLAMLALEAHRGPDDEGLWTGAEGRVVLGHRRLAIIDPTPAGRQPMASADGTCILTFNGEIYNYREVAAELAAVGVRLATRCDTEVLVEALRLWGHGALHRLNGMFSFALWDARTETLLCARDRFGEKPFLYVEGDGFFAFASEYKALLALQSVPAEDDRRRLASFLHRPSVALDDGRETVFPAIRQLLPGEMLVLDGRTLRTRVSRWWTPAPDAAAAGLGMGEAAERFRDLLIDSVRLRMRADVAQGSCLSGGLDSSSIVCIVRRLLGDDAPYDVFIGRFPETPADEGRWAALVAAAAHARTHEVMPTAGGLCRELPEFVWMNELPVGSASQYAQWCVFRLAREHGVTVLLDGQGADEMLAGYEQFFRLYLRDPDADRKERAAIRARYPLALAGGRERLSRALPRGLRRTVARVAGRGSDALFGMRSEIARVIDAPARAERTLAAALARETFREHLPTLLRYGDRNSMAHSREVRLPFCDHRLAEFALALPARHHMGNAETKRLLREAMRGILPEEVRTRWNKQGFVPPQDLWFRGALGDLAEATVNDPAFGSEGLWDRRWWQGALRRFRAGESALAAALWRPVMEQAWRRHFLARARAMPKHPVFL